MAAGPRRRGRHVVGREQPLVALQHQVAQAGRRQREAQPDREPTQLVGGAHQVHRLDQIVVAAPHDRVLGEVEPEAGGQHRDHQLAPAAVGVRARVVVRDVAAQEREVRDFRHQVERQPGLGAEQPGHARQPHLERAGLLAAPRPRPELDDIGAGRLGGERVAALVDHHADDVGRQRQAQADEHQRAIGRRIGRRRARPREHQHRDRDRRRRRPRTHLPRRPSR